MHRHILSFTSSFLLYQIAYFDENYDPINIKEQYKFVKKGIAFL